MPLNGSSKQGDTSKSSACDIFSPAGLKVLVVDDDPMCLKVVSAMLRRCSYEVETKSNGQEALELLRQRNEDGSKQFDLVLSDVYMPDIDGFRLLEQIGLELGLPVIMMSSDGDTNVVLRGVTHGAVDFLIKPVRIEELRNVWQHVVRRKSVTLPRTSTDNSIADADADSLRGSGTKRKESDGGPLRVELEGGGNGKRPRVVWSVEMHQQFVNAVNQLGIEKAVPKRILEIMNVEGLTRENVASHLQKYRLYLKRLENVQAGKGGRMPKPPVVEQQAAAERNARLATCATEHVDAAAAVCSAPAPAPALAPPGGVLSFPAYSLSVAPQQQQQQAYSLYGYPEGNPALSGLYAGSTSLYHGAAPAAAPPPPPHPPAYPNYVAPQPFSVGGGDVPLVQSHPTMDIWPKIDHQHGAYSASCTAREHSSDENSQDPARMATASLQPTTTGMLADGTGHAGLWDGLSEDLASKTLHDPDHDLVDIFLQERLANG